MLYLGFDAFYERLITQPGFIFLKLIKNQSMKNKFQYFYCSLIFWNIVVFMRLEVRCRMNNRMADLQQTNTVVTSRNLTKL
jgi:hypothetical protein